MTEENTDQESLDPEDWDAMHALAHTMVDDAMDYIRTVGDRKVWQRVPEEVARMLDVPVPHQPTSPQSVYAEFRENVMPYPTGNIHPRFWGWYMGNGTVMGAMADFMAAVMNPNLGGGNNSANLVEQQVTRWMKEIMGFPDSASGLLVSGGSVANLTGITVARNDRAGFDVREAGLQGDSPQLTIYGSTEAHSCIQKAAELLGIGQAGYRRIPVDEDYCMDIGALVWTVEADIDAGRRPVCIVASAGTVNTGSVDDLNAVADLCEEHGIWFHVDGAIGAVAMLSDVVRPTLSGIERADSIAMDLHKWMHIPFEVGCVLVKKPDAHLETFSLMPPYLKSGNAQGGMATGGHWFSEYGVQLSRGFRALKVWMTLKEHGTERLGRMISRNVEQAHYLAGLIDENELLECVAPVGMDIVCYRFNPGGMEDQALDTLNSRILVALQERGLAAPSYTTLHGRYCIRVAIANFRSTLSDFDFLVEQTVALGRELS